MNRMRHGFRVGMLKMLLAFSLVTISRQPCLAGEYDSKLSYGPSFKLKSHVLDKYLVTTGDLAHDKKVIQTELTVSFSNGLSVGTWHSLGPDGSWNNDYGDELDWFAFLSGQLFGCAAEAGAWYFDMVRMLEMPGGDILSPYIKLSRRFALDGRTGVTPLFRLDAYYPARGIWERGSIWRLGAAIDHGPVEGFSISAQGEVARDDGAFGNDSGLFLDFNLGISRELLCTKQPYRSLAWDVVGFRLMVPLTVHDKRDTETVLSSGLTFRWK